MIGLAGVVLIVMLPPAATCRLRPIKAGREAGRE